MVALRKLGQLLVTVVLVTLFASLLLELLPGDPVQVLVPFGSDEQREAVRADLELDQPFVARYGSWLGGFVTGDLGNYYTVSSTRPVSERVADALPVSLVLMIYAQVIALLIAIPVGVIAAYRKDTFFDRLSNTSAFAMLAIPTFALGFVLQYYLGVKLGWFKATGYTPITENPSEHLQTVVLPVITLAVGQVAVYMRLLRSDMIATLQQDFITMAKAKGLRNKRILFRHALRPSSLTLLTVAGLNVGTLIGGALIVEVVFGIPGMGFLLAEAIATRQVVAFQSMVAIIAIFYVLVNFSVDILYSVLDPRIRR
ncbi:MAG: ABC transporter permease [Actinobacteria bacterium]|jgi:peptide/nickel transport system permease protein|nr:ABC transporter permease [Actinomycetota bacterium]